MLHYPTVEWSEVDLEPFTQAGWKVSFEEDRERQTCFFCGEHEQLEMDFRIPLGDFELQTPDAIPGFLRYCWNDLSRDAEQKWPFPKMRIYTPDRLHEPANWQEVAELLYMEARTVVELQEELQRENFRRKNSIMLASPFQDRKGTILYELDVVNIGMDELAVLCDDSGKHWHAFRKNRTFCDASRVTKGIRIGITGVGIDGDPTMLLLFL